MKARNELILKAFLSKVAPEKRRSLEQFLPENERRALAALPLFDEGGPLERFSTESLLEKVHWSWFLPTLKSFSSRERQYFLAALTPGVAENLQQALSMKNGPEEITETGRQFLREQLLQSIAGPNQQHLPIGYLPSSPLNALLELNKKQFIRLIDLLSLYDLANELSQIVETKILKKIYSFLTEEQKAAMKQMGAHKDLHPLPRMGLDRWDGDEESLRNLLHKRGLMRLGLALSGASPDLIWTLCHQLDIGRGTALFKLCAKEARPGVSENIVRQIEELIGRLT